MQKRLIAFGCSYTYGQGLSDLDYDTYNQRIVGGPSKLAWPNLLATELGIPNVLNLSRPGSSNKEILKTVLDFDFKYGDTVCFLWSYSDRWCIYKENQNLLIGPWKTDKSSLEYYKRIYNEYDSKIDTYIRMNFANEFLKKKNIKNFHALVLKEDKLDIEWNSVRLLDCDFRDLRNRYITKCFHLSEEGHKIFSKEYLKHILKDK